MNLTVNEVVYTVASVSSSISLTTGGLTCPWGNDYEYYIYPGTYLGTVSTSDRYSIHDLRMSPAGNYLIISEGDYCYTSSCNQVHFSQVGTTTVGACPYTSGSNPDSGACQGHYTESATGWINGDSWYDCCGFTQYSPSMLYRTWANIGATSPTQTTELTTLNIAVDPSYDNHPSNKNDPYGTNSYPVFSNTWAPDDQNATTYAYSNEVDAWPQGTPGSVMRFGHTYDSAISPDSNLNNGAPSSTGQFYLFTTDGEGTLGNVNGTSACSLSGGTCRTDVFILNLTPPAS